MAKDIKHLSPFLLKFKDFIDKGLIHKVKKDLKIQVDKNFQKEGYITDDTKRRKKWDKLKPSTIKTRKYKNKPILQQTGKLKRSIKVQIRNKKIRVKAISYAKYHQLGTNKMKSRPIITIPQRKTIQKLLKQAFKSPR